jgi:hypothetical protein
MNASQRWTHERVVEIRTNASFSDPPRFLWNIYDMRCESGVQLSLMTTWFGDKAPQVGDVFSVMWSPKNWYLAVYWGERRLFDITQEPREA